MHPQALIIDDSAVEENHLREAAKARAPGLEIPLIELPQGGPKRLTWLTKLDSSSLAGRPIGTKNNTPPDSDQMID